jgi:uncharacterized protein
MLIAGASDELGIQEALKWLRLAAMAEHGGALTALARYHLKEQFGLEPISAVELLERGVAVGHPGAMEELAKLFAEGRLVKKNRSKALELAKKGADRGHQGSSRFLKELQSSDEANVSTTEQSAPQKITKKEG